MREKDFENQIKQFLKDNGIYYAKQFGCAYTRAGTPDLLCCVNGKFVGIEVKAEKGIVSKLQYEHIEEIKQANGIAFTVYPKDFEKMKELILSLMVK